MKQNIFIIGATGNVGKRLIQQIYSVEEKNKEYMTNIVGIASKNEYLFNNKGINQVYVNNFSKKIISGNKYNSLEEIIKLVKKSKNIEDLTFIDVTADNNIFNFHKEIITNTNYNIVTANKNPITFCSYEDFKILTKYPQRYGYRCSVMAGAESVIAIQDFRDLCDDIISISGCFSGTLGYITSKLDENEEKFSNIVKIAKEYGFTEPHPKEDLNGLDVAKKLLILARTAGYKLSIDDIKIKPFIDEKYLNESDINKFMSRLSNLDYLFEKKVKESKSKNEVLRYIGRFNKNNQNEYELTVGLESVSKNSYLGSLNGTLNKIIIETSNSYPKSLEYCIQAPGAGLDVTAQNIRRDLLYQLKNRKTRL